MNYGIESTDTSSNTNSETDDEPRSVANTTVLESIIDDSPDCIIIADSESGQIIAANDTALARLGKDRNDLVGQHHSIIHPSEERPRATKLFQQTSRSDSGPVSRYQDGSRIHLESSSGHRTPVEINASIKEFGDQTIVQGHFRNISGRIERERRLEVFQEAVDRAGHSIFITDADGHFEYVNPAFEEVSGYEASEVIGKRPSVLKSGVHDESFYEALWTTITNGDVWEGELVNEAKDGSRYHIEQTISPIFDDFNDIERFVAINKDITERIQQRRRLQRERERLEEFSTTVAHDLRTPLSVAMGHIDLAMEGSRSPELERAQDALERMRRFIDEILTLSTQGETVDDPEPVCVMEVITDSWELIDAPNADCQVVVDEEYSVLADRRRLGQLFQNLFENAVIHVGEDVTIRVKELDDRPGFSVADDGQGIDPGDRARVFDSGYSQHGGTGYGLSIVQQIVQAHGWEVTIDDAAKLGGAEFVITTEPSIPAVY